MQAFDPYKEISRIYGNLANAKQRNIDSVPVSFEDAALLLGFNLPELRVYATFTSGRYKNQTANIWTCEKLDEIASVYDFNLKATVMTNVPVLGA